MSSGAPLNGFTAAATILKWLRAAHGQAVVRIDLDQVREGLPGSPLGKDVRVIKPPMPSPVEHCEGSPSAGTHTVTVTRSYYTGTMRLSVLVLKR